MKQHARAWWRLAIVLFPLLGSSNIYADDSVAVGRLLFYTKSSGYEHSVVHRQGDSPAFAERIMMELANAHSIELTVTKDGSVFDGDLDRYDAILFYTTGDLTSVGNDGHPPMSQSGKQRMLDAVAAGMGFVGVHSATDTFHSPGNSLTNQRSVDPYIEMIGGEFVRHGRQQAALMKIVDSQFPGMPSSRTGFAMLEEWYSLKNFQSDLHVLLVNETKGLEGIEYDRPPFPATWTRMHNKGRVFYTSMGHREDVWSNPLFQQILFGRNPLGNG